MARPASTQTKPSGKRNAIREHGAQRGFHLSSCLISGNRTARGNNTPVSFMARGRDISSMSISRDTRPKRPLPFSSTAVAGKAAPAISILSSVLRSRRKAFSPSWQIIRSFRPRGFLRLSRTSASRPLSHTNAATMGRRSLTAGADGTFGGRLHRGDAGVRSAVARAGRSHSQTDLAGFIGLAGPYDFLPIQSRTLRTIFGGANRTETQPISFVTGKEAPALLITAMARIAVSPANSRRMAAQICAHGGVAEERTYGGVGHLTLIGAFAPGLRVLAPVLRDVTQFVWRVTSSRGLRN